MSTRTSRWMAAAALALTAYPATAFVRARHPSNGSTLRRADFAGITLQINNRTAGGLANGSGQTVISTGSDPQAALRAAMDTWTNVTNSSVTFLAPVPTPEDGFKGDGQHIVTFVDTPANRALTGDALAVTVVLFGFLGDIIDTDVIFSPTKLFSTNNIAGSYDLQSVATHEFGHALGAGHSGLLAATMFQSTRPNLAIQARLTADDEAFAISAYPEPLVLSSLGALTGNVRSLLGRNIFGALVTAVNPATGVAIGSISDRDGSYRIPALPAGDYVVFAEPANGPVTASALGAYYGDIDTDFLTGFTGGSPSPSTIQVTAAGTTTANFTVLDDTAFRNIQFAAVTTVGGTNFSNVTSGPVQVRAGDSFDLALGGPGLDDKAIVEEDLLLLGAGLSIRRGSFRRGLDLLGLPAIGIGVQVASAAPYGTGTLVIKHVREAIAYTAGLKVTPGAGPGPGGTAPPTLQVSPTILTFTTTQESGVVRPSNVQVVALSGTAGLNWTATAATATGGNWLLVSPASGTVPGRLEVLVQAGDLAPAVYGGQVTVRAPDVTAQVVQVTLVVEPPPPPTILEGGVVNAASFLGGGVVPGELVTILGADMGPRQQVTAARDAGGNLPTALANVTVLMRGRPIPLSYVSHQQIGAQVPWELASESATDVVVEYRGRRGEPRVMRVLETRPGIFTYGPGREAPAFNAAAFNEDGSPNSPLSQAPVGTVVQLFLTGQGTVSPVVATGQASPATAPFPAPLRPVRASIGGVDAPVIFAGLAPDQVGVLQVNLIVPPGFFPDENVPVIIQVGNAQTQANVTIAVR